MNSNEPTAPNRSARKMMTKATEEMVADIVSDAFILYGVREFTAKAILADVLNEVAAALRSQSP